MGGDQDSQDAGAVLLGFDPGWQMPHPLDVAADEAAVRGSPLIVVTVRRLEEYQDLHLSSLPEMGENWRTWTASESRRLLRVAARRAQERHPGLRVSVLSPGPEEVRPGIEPFDDARLLVIGGPNRFGIRPFGLNSTSRMLKTAVTCPILVVPGGVARAEQPRGHAPVAGGVADVPGPVVGAVGWGEAAVEVIRVCQEEALRRGADLHLVRVVADRPGEDRTVLMRRAAHEVSALVERAGAAADTTWDLVLSRKPVAATLRERAARAQLLVLGTRPGSASGLIPDAVTRQLLQDSPCPVMMLALPTRANARRERDLRPAGGRAPDGGAD